MAEGGEHRGQDIRGSSVNIYNYGPNRIDIKDSMIREIHEVAGNNDEANNQEDPAVHGDVVEADYVQNDSNRYTNTSVNPSHFAPSSKSLTGPDWVQLSERIYMNKSQPLKAGAKVFRGKQNLAGEWRDIAIKLIQYDEQNLKEIQILQKLEHHSNVIYVIDAGVITQQVTSHIFIAMELCPQTLKDFINENMQKPFDFEKMFSYAKQVVVGVAFIHKNNILHRDIKLENILLSPCKEFVRVADFGLSKQIAKGQSVDQVSLQGLGTEGYQAPEMHHKNPEASFQSDSFSLGIVLALLFSSGRHPFGQDANRWRTNIIDNAGLDLSHVHYFCEPYSHKRAQLLDLINNCLQCSRHDRHTPENMLKHSFFSNLAGQMEVPSNHAGSMEFRVIIIGQHLRNDGWRPCISFDQQEYLPMEKNKRRGYFHFQQKFHDKDIHFYRYYLVKGNKTHFRAYAEHLPQTDFMRCAKQKGEEKQIILDVSTFNEFHYEWIKTVEDYFLLFLPRTGIAFNRAEIEYWFDTAISGWNFKNMSMQSTNNFILKTEKIEKMIKKWMQDVMKSKNSTEVATLSLSVIVASEKRNRTFNDYDLQKLVLRGLQIEEMSGYMQQELYSKINDSFTKTSLLQFLNMFFLSCMDNTQVSLILALPLYRLISFNGDAEPIRLEGYIPDMLEIKAMLLPDLPWRDFCGRIAKDTNMHSKLIKISSNILMLSQTHPYIVDTYHYFLPWKATIKLIKEKDPVAAKFQLDSLFAQILPYLRSYKKQDLKYIMGDDVSAHLCERFQDHIQAATNISETHKKKSTVMYLLKSIVEEISWHDVKLNNFDKLRQKCFIWLLSMASLCFEWLYTLNSTISDIAHLDEEFDKILESVKSIMCKYYGNSKELRDQQITFYTEVIKKDWHYDVFKQTWIEAISKEISQYVDMETDDEDFLSYYAKIAKVSFLIALGPFLSSVISKMSEGQKIGATNPIAAAFERTFMKYDTDGDFTIQTLKFMAESPMALILYKEFDHDTLSKLMTSTSCQTLNRFNNEACLLSRKISQKEITIKEMEIILNKRARMEELLTCIHNHMLKRASGTANHEIAMLIKSSENIISSYRLRCDAMTSFINFCLSIAKENIEVDCADLRSSRQFQANLSLKEAENSAVEEKYLKEMILINKVQGSEILKQVTTEVASELYHKSPGTYSGQALIMNWKKGLKDVWKVVKTKLICLMDSLQKGVMTNDDILHTFKSLGNVSKDLEDELQYLMILWEGSSDHDADRNYTI